MRKEKHEVDADFDIDFDDFDLPDIDDLDDLDGKRKAVESIPLEMAEGFKSQLASKSFREMFIKSALPKEYESSVDAVATGVEGIRDLYNTTAEETKTVSRELARLIGRTIPGSGRLVPKSIKEAFKDWSAKEDKIRGLTDKDRDDAAVAAELTEIFDYQNKKEEEQRERDEAEAVVKDTIEDKRHSLSREIGREQTKLLSRLVNYQDSILSKYQRRSLDLQLRQYMVTSRTYDAMIRSDHRRDQLLQAVVKNTALPEFAKLRHSEFARASIRSRLMDNLTESVIQRPVDAMRRRLSETFNRGLSDLGKSLKENLGLIGDTLEDVREMSEDGGGVPISDVASRAVGGGIANKFGGWVGGKLRPIMERNPVIAKMGNEADSFISNRELYINKFVRDNPIDKWIADRSMKRFMESLDDDGPRSFKASFKDIMADNAEWLLGGLWSNIRDRIPMFREMSSLTKGTARQGLDDPGIITDRYVRTVEEVIPGYLRKILSSIDLLRGGSGAEQVYRFGSMGFETRESVGEELRSKLFNEGMIKAYKESLDSVVSEIFEDMDVDDEVRDKVKDYVHRQARDLSSISIDEIGELVSDEHREALVSKYGTGFKERDVTQSDAHARLQRKHQGFVNTTPDGRGIIQKDLALEGNLALEQLGDLIVKREDGGLDFNQDLYYKIIMGHDEPPTPFTPPPSDYTKPPTPPPAPPTIVERIEKEKLEDVSSPIEVDESVTTPEEEERKNFIAGIRDKGRDTLNKLSPVVSNLSNKVPTTKLTNITGGETIINKDTPILIEKGIKEIVSDIRDTVMGHREDDERYHEDYVSDSKRQSEEEEKRSNSLKDHFKDVVGDLKDSISKDEDTTRSATVMAVNRLHNLEASDKGQATIPHDTASGDDKASNIAQSLGVSAIYDKFYRMKQRLKRIRGMASEFADVDGDGVRDGSWRERLGKGYGKLRDGYNKATKKKDGSPRSTLGKMFGIVKGIGTGLFSIGKYLLSGGGFAAMAALGAAFSSNGVARLAFGALYVALRHGGTLSKIAGAFGKKGWIAVTLAKTFKHLKTMWTGIRAFFAWRKMAEAARVARDLAGKGLGRLADVAGKGGFWSKAGRLAGWAGRGALTAAAAAGKGALAVGAGVGKVAAGVATAAVSTVGIAVIGVAALAVAGYFIYKHLQDKKKVLVRMRMLQYGVPKKKKYLQMIDTLEQSLIGYVKMPLKEGSSAEIVGDVDFEQVFELFEIPETDEASRNELLTWYHERFLPVYLKQMTAMFSVTMDYRLSLTPKDIVDIDDKTPNPEVKKQLILRGMVSADVTNVTASPFPGVELVSTAIDVDLFYEEVMEKLAKQIAKSSEPALVQYEIDDATGDNQHISALQRKQQEVQDQWTKDVKERDDRLAKEMAEYEQTLRTNASNAIMDRIKRSRARQELLRNAQQVVNHSRLYDQTDMSTQGINEQGWTWPTEGGRISSEYGYRVHPITGNYSGHRGVDIAAPEGTPVYAAKDGVIFRREFSTSYGNVIYIKHDDGTASRYAHMHNFAPGLSNGDRVMAGETIGYVGNTGQSKGNHLHFEIRKTTAWDAETVNPLALIGTPDQKSKAKAEIDEAKAAAKGKDRDVEDDPDNPAEGEDTIASTEVGEATTPPDVVDDPTSTFSVTSAVDNVMRDNKPASGVRQADNAIPQILESARLRGEDEKVRAVRLSNEQSRKVAASHYEARARHSDQSLSYQSQLVDILVDHLNETKSIGDTLKDIKDDVVKISGNMAKPEEPDKGNWYARFMPSGPIDRGAGDPPINMR